MDIGMIIGTVVALIIMIVPLIIFFKTKDRKESLVIMKDGDTMKLFLSDDDYCDFCKCGFASLHDISDIKDDQKRVNEELVKVIKARAKELVKFVDRVTFFKDGDEKFEKELLEIIQQAKA